MATNSIKEYNVINNNNIFYAICSTKENILEKTVNYSGFILHDGAEIIIRFEYTNQRENPTLNVNNTGAKPIYYRGAAISAPYLAATRTYLFVYNGNQYELVGDLTNVYSEASMTENGLITAEEKYKLFNIEENANNYIHPTGAGNNHIPFGGEEGQILRWVSNGVADWGEDLNTEYSDASDTTSGLMSSADKIKLDGIENNANNYTLPEAGSTLGGVKSGGDVTIENGIVTVNDNSHSHTTSTITDLDDVLSDYVMVSEKGSANGVATLGEDGKLSSAQIPGSIDEILEYEGIENFPEVGESGKLYVDTVYNKTYRWSGTQYTVVSDSLALGETSTTAYRGDLGKVTYVHSQTQGNPHKTKYSELKQIPSSFTPSAHVHKSNEINKLNNYVKAEEFSAITETDSLNEALGKLEKGLDLKPDTNTTYEEATATTSGLMSSEDKSKLDSIATGANNYTLPTTSSDTLGGIKIGYTQINKNYPVQLDTDNKAYVNVPWTDADTLYSEATTTISGLMSNTDKSKLDGIDINANNYTLPTAENELLGGIKTGYTQSDRNYPVELDENSKAYVNVPWTDTTYSTGTTTTSGLTKLYTETGSNEDGTITQNAITTELSGKADVVPATTAGSAMIWNGTSWAAQEGYGYEVEKIDYIYQNITLTDFDGEEIFEVWQQTPLLKDIVIGRTYTVTWDGTDYECTAFDINQSGHAGLGNAAFIDGTDTNEPFMYISEMLIENGDDEWSIYDTWLTSTYTDVTISVKGLANFTYQLDTKFIPNNNVRNGSGKSSVEEGHKNTTSSGDYSHAEGRKTTASGYSSHAEGNYTTAEGDESHAEGCETTASGGDSHAEGNYTTASGFASHAEGNVTTASGSSSHAEGNYTTASGEDSHAEGENTTASGDYSHSEGQYTTASGMKSHAEGDRAKASGDISHAEGYCTTASGVYSHSEGHYTTAASQYQHVQGKFNVIDSNSTYADIVGWGSNSSQRENISALTTGGTLRLKGSVYVNCNDNSTGGSELSTKSYVDTGLSTKLDSSNVTSKGSAINPVYFDDSGAATATTYTLEKSVPSDAKFTDTTYSNATTSAAGLMSSSDKTKLNGIADGANNYSLPTSASDTLGGIKIGYTQSGKNYPVALDTNNKAYVNVPWTDTHYTNTLKIQAAGTEAISFAQNSDKTLNIKGSGITTVSKTADGEITVSSTVPTTSSDALGGIKIGYTQSDKNYPVVLDSNSKAYVNVPWTDTTYNTGTATTSGLTKLYTGTGTNTDGTMTQNAINTALSGKSDTSHTHGDLYYTESEIDAALNNKLNTSLKGAKSGLAELDSNGKVPSTQLPSYVDDVIEAYYYNDKFYTESAHTTLITGESGKIYVDLSTNKTYRWSGSAYVEISQSLAIGTTASTAAAGNHNHDGVYQPVGNYQAAGNYKTTQTAVSDPSASGTSVTFIDSISQNTNGVISPTKKTVSTASTSAAGLMSSEDKTKLNGIAIGANNYTLPTSTSSALGGIKIGYTQSDKNYPVQLDSNSKAYVNVPWTDNNTTYSNATTSTAGLMSSTDKSKLDGIAASANNYTLPASTSDALGGIKTGYTQTGKNYPVVLDTNSKAYVNVPWTDNNTTYSNATTSAAGLMSSDDKTKLNGIATGATANTGTVTSVAVKMNNTTKGTITTSGEIDLGTVITSHQDISGKEDTSNKVSSWSSTTTDTNYPSEKLVKTSVDAKLDKVTYEWNKEILFGASGYLLIGKFPCYDTNITIDIDSTTSTTYHGTLVIATQNITQAKGGTQVCNVYGDVSGTVSDSFYVQYQNGSCKLNVYFKPQAWSKNLIHIRATSLGIGRYASDTLDESEICTSVTSVPTTDLLTIKNLLTTALNSKQATISDLSTIRTNATTGAEHAALKNNPHGVTASDVGIFPNASGPAESVLSTITISGEKYDILDTVYTHPTTTATNASAVKVGKDSTGHVVLGSALTYSDVGAAASNHNHSGVYQPVGNYKTTQTAVSDPSANGTSITFIDSISQNTNGVITPTKKTVSTATTSAAGLMSSDDKTKLSNIAAGANNYSLPTSTSSVLGGIKIGYTQSGQNYPVALDSNNKAYVYVPWANSDTTYNTGTTTTAGLTKLYTGTGTNTDGTMTQNAINTALGNKQDTITFTTVGSGTDPYDEFDCMTLIV